VRDKCLVHAKKKKFNKFKDSLMIKSIIFLKKYNNITKKYFNNKYAVENSL
jgi:hypothetical protein